MAQFDPTQRRETWVFQKTGTDPVFGKTIYRRMGFNLVSYDGSPELSIEPINNEQVAPSFNNGSGTVIVPNVDGPGQVVDFQFFEGRPYEVHSFGDNTGDLRTGS